MPGVRRIRGGRIKEIRQKYGNAWRARLVHFGCWHYEGPLNGEMVSVNPYSAGLDEWGESTGTIWRAFIGNKAVGRGMTPLQAIDDAARGSNHAT